MYQQAPENTLESLVHAMELFDAIEFDIRLTKDNHVVIHHDRTVSIAPSLRKGRSPFVEDWNLDELLDLGFCSFEMLLERYLHSTCCPRGRQGSRGRIETSKPQGETKWGMVCYEETRHPHGRDDEAC